VSVAAVRGAQRRGRSRSVRPGGFRCPRSGATWAGPTAARHHQRQRARTRSGAKRSAAPER